jgi:hypothetical protein
VSRVARLLQKDLRVLRRSPLLLGILLAYPLVIAGLVGLVASYANAKPRVALFFSAARFDLEPLGAAAREGAWLAALTLVLALAARTAVHRLPA